MKKKSVFRRFLPYLLLIAGALVMVFPLIWMFFATFKTNNEIFSSTAMLPQNWGMEAYVEGWKSTGQYTFATYFANTFKLVLPTVFFTLLSSMLVAYGFARFKFPFCKQLYGLMIATLFLPASVIIIPRYLIYRDLQWLDSYMPFWAPAILACNPFFIFMMVQFLRGLPLDLDESARLDGCNSFQILVFIIIPLLVPALISAAIFQLMWTWNDFFNSLIYISSVKHYPLSLALRMGMDVSAVSNWNEILAMALVSIIPLVVVFFCLQKYFVEGVATTGLKA